MISLAVLSDVRLASGSQDNTIRVWDLGSGACDRVLEEHTYVSEDDEHVYRTYERMIVVINRLIIMIVYK